MMTPDEKAKELLQSYQDAGLGNPVQGGTSGLWYSIHSYAAGGYEWLLLPSPNREFKGLPPTFHIFVDPRPYPGVLCANAFGWREPMTGTMPPPEDILLGLSVQIQADELGLLRHVNWFPTGPDRRMYGDGKTGGFLEATYFRNAMYSSAPCGCGHLYKLHVAGRCVGFGGQLEDYPKDLYFQSCACVRWDPAEKPIR